MTYRAYRDPHSGLSVQVPARYRTETPKTDGPQYLLSPDGRVRLTPTDEANFTGASPRQWLTIRTNVYGQDGASVTYTSIDGPVVIISGIDHGQVYYDRFVVYSHIVYELFWTYPPALKKSLDPVVEHTVATFHPGPNRWS